jgi:hypothetical protein
MNGLSKIPFASAQATRLLLLIALSAMCCLCMLGNSHVTIKGQLLASDDDFSTARVLVISASGTQELDVKADGRYNITVCAKEPVLLRFEKGGHITKEVKLNTNNIFASKMAIKKNRILRFNVELMPENFGVDLAFIAPVGEIRFLNGSGLMKVERMYAMKAIHGPDSPDGKGVTSDM